MNGKPPLGVVAMTDSNPPPVRCLSVQLTIAEGDQRRSYRCVPLPHEPGSYRAYRLVKFIFPQGEQPGQYVCRLHENGTTSCTCPHGRLRPESPTRCKHIE